MTTVDEIKNRNYNLDIKNPNAEAAKHGDPDELLAEYKQLLKELAGERFRRGIVLYSGRQCVPLGKDLHALPIESLWRIRAQKKRT